MIKNRFLKKRFFIFYLFCYYYHMKIAIIGFGKFGRALADILTKNNDNQILAWDIAKIDDYRWRSNRSEVINGADFIFFAVPSAFFSQAVVDIENIPQNAILISGTKGVDAHTGKFPYEVLQTAFPQNTVAVLGGPMLASELAEGKMTAADIAVKHFDDFQKIEALFQNTNLSVGYCNDLLGVSLSGVLKNIYTLLFGLSDGLSLGANFKACLVRNAIQEMSRIIEVLGGDRETVFGYAAIGDLLATGYSDLSRNYRFGYSFANGKNMD
ncbi:hypothetical protein D6827_02835, partial [Candidatus Parcubacteria bacterium]